MVSDDRALGGRTDPRLVADLIRLTVAVGIILCCFVVATPRNGGPDETSHTVYSAALVRGDALRASNGFGVFLVPEMVGRPSTECWALQSFVPADCASLGSSSTDLAPASTLAADYAPYAYLLPGLASFVPSPAAYMYLARLLMASIPFLLVVSGLARLRRHAGPGAFAAALLGLTPIAWFSMSIVNPSAVAIAGGFALWVALLTPADRRADMLLVAAWACVLLPRRDGPLWATLIVLAVCMAGRRRPREIWDGLRHWARWAVGILAAVPVVTTVAMGADELEVVLALAPLSLLAVPALVTAYERSTSRGLFVGSLIAAGIAVSTLVIAVFRPDGIEAWVVRLVVSKTGEHLRQLVGVLSSLDAPVPTSAVVLFWVAVGGLVAVARLESPRVALTGVVSIAATIYLAWVLELGQGSDTGSYWQGRYSVPFTVGLPLLLAVRFRHDAVGSSRAVDTFARPLAVAAWFIWNAGFLAALQRWGVGLAGSWWPWEWDTWGAPVPPWLLALVHAAATALLAGVALRSRSSDSPARSLDGEPAASHGQ